MAFRWLVFCSGFLCLRQDEDLKSWVRIFLSMVIRGSIRFFIAWVFEACCFFLFFSSYSIINPVAFMELAWSFWFEILLVCGDWFGWSWIFLRKSSWNLNVQTSKQKMEPNEAMEISERQAVSFEYSNSWHRLLNSFFFISTRDGWNFWCFGEGDNGLKAEKYLSKLNFQLQIFEIKLNSSLLNALCKEVFSVKEFSKTESSIDCAQ